LQRSFYTQNIFLRTEAIYTQILLHIETLFAHRSFSTQNFFYKKKKTQNFLYIIFFNMQKFSNTTPFTQIFLKCKHFCTKKLLNTKTFFAQTLLHTKSFKHKSFFAKKLLHTKHSIFYVQSLLHAIKPHFVRKD
jgi:hypothetical protein